jgi:hypothetical protein
MGGQIIDASVVPAPRQRKTGEEKAAFGRGLCENVVSLLSPCEEVGVSPDRSFESDDLAPLQPDMLFGIPPGKSGCHSRQGFNVGCSLMIH